MAVLLGRCGEMSCSFHVLLSPIHTDTRMIVLLNAAPSLRTVPEPTTRLQDRLIRPKAMKHTPVQ